MRRHLNEDSLDDFDIDGKIRKKRESIPQETKDLVDNQIKLYMIQLFLICDDFFEEKNLNIKKSKYSNSHSYKIYYPDLGWGFTYEDENYVYFEIVVGEYGYIGNIKDEKSCKSIMKQLRDRIKKEIPYFSDYNSIWQDSINGINSAAWILRMQITLRDMMDSDLELLNI